MRTTRLDHLRRLLRQAPPPTAQALAATLRVSQPTVSRELAGLGDEVLRLGRARQTRYALARNLGRLGSRWPLYRIDASGRAHELAMLAAAGAEGYVLQPRKPLPAWTHGEFALGWYDGLPWFLDDLRPQGFLGRAFAHRVAPVLQLHVDPTRWSNDEVAIALLVHGHDGPGDLVLGDAMLERALHDILAPQAVIAVSERAAHYPKLAEAALQGEAIGSSAGGEQPKFTATLRDHDDARAAAPRHRACIVKFSDRIDTPTGQRWSDLLRCEHHAAQVLNEHGVAAARTTIVEAGGRTFLEATRFDRTDVLGRRGLVSLRALDAAFHGHGAIDWWRYAPVLEREGWIDTQDAERLRVLGLFGALIGNSDMHLGNVSLVLTDERPFALAPAYDMLPMRFAPGPGGEVVARSLEVLPPTPEVQAAWTRAAAAASVYWQRVASDGRISAAMRDIADAAARKVDAARARFAS